MKLGKFEITEDTKELPEALNKAEDEVFVIVSDVVAVHVKDAGGPEEVFGKKKLRLIVPHGAVRDEKGQIIGAIEFKEYN